jgi:hypothetical protein
VLCSNGRGEGSDPRSRLRIILARLLLEVQGATLTCTPAADGAWTALVTFPAKG